jgi:hypothetical protein
VNDIGSMAQCFARALLEPNVYWGDHWIPEYPPSPRSMRSAVFEGGDPRSVLLMKCITRNHVVNLNAIIQNSNCDSRLITYLPWTQRVLGKQMPERSDREMRYFHIHASRNRDLRRLIVRASHRSIDDGSCREIYTCLSYAWNLKFCISVLLMTRSADRIPSNMNPGFDLFRLEEL